MQSLILLNIMLNGIIVSMYNHYLSGDNWIGKYVLYLPIKQSNYLYIKHYIVYLSTDYYINLYAAIEQIFLLFF